MNTLSQRVKRFGAIALAMMLVPLSSCGDSAGPNDSVYLFVINGYTAAGTLSLFGPRGPVVQGLKFGERTPTPIEVDRSLGTDFTLLLDGAPEQIELDVQLFSMYPQETGTIFIKRRTDLSDATVALYRHVQTISPNCAWTFENALSLDNQYLTVGSFSWAPEFEYGLPDAGYFDEVNVPVVTECGQLPLPTRDPIPRDFTADPTNIAADPWFFKTQCQNSLFPNAVCNVWGELDNGDIIGVSPTLQYYECIAQAVTIKQDEMAPPSPFPPADSQVQCPPGDLTWDDVQVDPIGVAECKASQRYPAFLLEPEEGNKTWSYLTDECQLTFRIRNDGLAVRGGFDIIFGPDPDGKDPKKGEHLDGRLIYSDISVPPGSEHFFVLFGRPVNPLVWQWNSGQNFVDLKQYPYFNDQDRRIGDSDDEGKGNPASSGN